MKKLLLTITYAALLVVPGLAPGAGVSSEPRATNQVTAGFEDALDRVSITLAAEPGRDGAWQWTPPSKGSIRLVGHFRPISARGKTGFEVLVDGRTAWKKEFGPSDGIRQGFDVPLYDLGPQSKVAVRLVATSGPSRADAMFAVLPEPFLSRWSAELPSGYPAWSEETRKTLRAKGQEVLQSIRDASDKRRGRVVIPPGDYLFHANWSRASTLREIRDLEVIAEGVTFWFEPPMVHALLFEHCRNVTVRGLTIDFTVPCWFQARVTEVDRVAKTVRAVVMPGYEPRNPNGQVETQGDRALMFYDAEGRFINQRHSPGEWQLTGEGKTLVCRNIRLAGIPTVLKAGDYVVGALRTGAAVRSSDCAGMRFEDVNVWSSPGIAVNENGGEGGHVYRRVRATRRPQTNRLHAFGADIFHLAGADRGPTLDRCELAYGSDDNLNIHGSFGRVVQRVDARHYYLQGDYAAGDTIEFRDQRSVALLGVAKVLSARQTPDGPALPINDKYSAKGEVAVELDTPLELPPLSLVVLDGKRSAGGFVLRNCWLHDNFQRTLINGSPDGLIENNTLQNVGHGLVIQFETWGPWMEGPFARNLVIRGNRFMDAPPDGGVITVSMHPPGGGSNARRFQAKPVTNLTIVGNDVARTSHPPLIIHNVDGLKIEGNSIDHPAEAPAHKGPANASGVNWLYLQDCTNVVVRDNLDPSPSGLKQVPVR
jgi:hypothetical protein